MSDVGNAGNRTFTIDRHPSVRIRCGSKGRWLIELQLIGRLVCQSDTVALRKSQLVSGVGANAAPAGSAADRPASAGRIIRALKMRLAEDNIFNPEESQRRKNFQTFDRPLSHPEVFMRMCTFRSISLHTILKDMTAVRRMEAAAGIRSNQRGFVDLPTCSWVSTHAGLGVWLPV